MRTVRLTIILLCSFFLLSCTSAEKVRRSGIIYVSSAGPGEEIRLISTDDSEQRVLVESEDSVFEAAWVSPSGEQILYRTKVNSEEDQAEWRIMNTDGSEPTLFLQRTGPRVLSASWSFNGKKIAFATPLEKGNSVCSHEFYVANRADGALAKLPVTGWHYEWSPTDDRIAVLCTDGKPVGMYVVDIGTGGKKELLTDVEIPDPQLAWSPDGRSIALPLRTSQGRTAQGIFVVDVDSGHLRQVTTDDTKYLYRTISCLSWSPKMDKILFVSDYGTQEMKESWALFVLDVASGKESKVAEEVRWGCPVWSPDGEEIAYVSTAHPNPQYHQYGQIFRLNLATGKLTQLTDDLNPKYSLLWGWVVLPQTEH